MGEALILVGAVLAALASLGVVRLRTALERTHALTKAATGGLVLALVGGAISLGTASAATTLLLACTLQLFTFPVGANLVAHAVYKRGDADGRAPSDTGGAVPPRSPRDERRPR